MGELLQGKGAGLGRYATRFPLPERTMLHVLRARAQEHPDRTWLVFDGEDGAPVELTFGAAQDRVHQVAQALHTDLGDPVHVGIFLRNQVEFFPALYGAMASGGVAVPLNADARGVLLERVIGQAEISVLVARADLLDRLGELDDLGAVELIVAAGADPGALPAQVGGRRVVAFDAWIEGRSTEPVRELPDSSEVAMIQFTSGTTGNSKGVVYPHHFFYLYSALVSDAQEHTEDDVLSTPLPLFHVAAIHIVSNSALHAGCRGVLKTKFSARTYWDEIARDGATFAILLGPLAAILLKTVPEAPEHRLAKLFCLPFPPGGEEFEERFRTKILWQGYGMTEVYPHPMSHTMEEGVPYDTVGHAAAFMDYGVVDEHDRLLGPGELGQLVYRPRLPDAMARGYYKNPEATVEAFRNFMFHTGDVGIIDEEGRVHYRGRVQDRIRRRGENISAAELEFIASGHEAIVEAAAYGVPGEFGEHEVKLDVVSCVADLDPAAYHAWLTEQLPRYMVPRYLELLPELPKSPSEKVQKHKLAEAGVDRPGVLVFEPVRSR
ncbi:AMP-binding protein [Baekduia soli]|uniref:AMP-binding protein n=1 Tax=Baekduia soli TaxID=496014 RepID=A0A5B8UBW6_9ACTN|nr:AMP-binding protein [Baekduia soli]QEC50545.1 AMP-binding protein [Baekduia soli]